jgi:DNA-binding transcriptional ArsR family regulator
MKDQSRRQVAKLFHLLSHPARLSILDELRREEACVCHLQTVLGRPQAYVSQQLRVLREAGVVVDSKEGLNVYYRLADQKIERLLEETLGPAGLPTRSPTCPCPRCQEREGTCATPDLSPAEERIRSDRSAEPPGEHRLRRRRSITDQGIHPGSFEV